MRPSLVVGHSVGEIVAACMAGVMSMETGLKMAIERGRSEMLDFASVSVTTTLDSDVCGLGALLTFVSKFRIGT